MFLLNQISAPLHFRSQYTAIQILEYFDRIGFTRRRGNDHLLRDALLFPEK